jgi:hypothetical protein
MQTVELVMVEGFGSHLMDPVIEGNGLMGALT